MRLSNRRPSGVRISGIFAASLAWTAGFGFAATAGLAASERTQAPQNGASAPGADRGDPPAVSAPAPVPPVTPPTPALGANSTVPERIDPPATVTGQKATPPAESR